MTVYDIFQGVDFNVNILFLFNVISFFTGILIPFKL